MSPLISGLASVASMIFNAASSGTAKAPARRGGDAAAPEPSSLVTLSPEAQALAGMAGQGVLASSSPTSASPASLATSATSATAGTVSAVGRLGSAPAGGPAGAVSKDDFQALLTRFGATEDQKQQLTQGFDSDKNGVITRDEFLQGLARTRGPQAGSDAFSQTVLQVMDQAGNANGTVAKEEFTALTSAFAMAERHVRRA